MKGRNFILNIAIVICLIFVNYLLILDANYKTFQHLGYKVYAKITNDQDLLNKNFNTNALKVMNYKEVDSIESRPNVCVIEDLPNHTKKVVNSLKYFYNGEIEIFSSDILLYKNEMLKHCNVINASLTFPEGLSEELEENFVQFLKEWNGLLITPAGNDGKLRTEEEQYFNTLKDELPNQIIVVGEAHMHFGKVFYSDVAYGNGVDIVVPSKNLSIKGDLISGTSMSAPVVTAKVANLLQKESFLSREDLYNETLKSNKTIEHTKNSKTFTYKILQF